MVTLTTLRFGQVIPIERITWVGKGANPYLNRGVDGNQDMTPEMASLSLVSALNNLGSYRVKKIPVDVTRKLPRIIPDLQFLQVIGKQLRDAFAQRVPDFRLPDPKQETLMGAQLVNLGTHRLRNKDGQYFLLTGEDCQKWVDINAREQRVKKKATRTVRDRERGDYQHTTKDVGILKDARTESERLWEAQIAAAKASKIGIEVEVKDRQHYHGYNFGSHEHEKHLAIESFKFVDRTPTT